MSLRKYQSVESATVATPEDHKKIETELHKVGKTSARDLNADQRRAVLDTVDTREEV